MNKERFAMDVKKLKESLEGKDQGKYFCEIFNNNVDILVIDGGMKKHEAIVQVLEDVKMLYKNDWSRIKNLKVNTTNIRIWN